MRSTSYVLGIGLVLTGCAASTGPRGGTYREYAGTTQVIVTNATPDKMCELHLSYDDTRDFGDNWLPDAGLASGQSIEFKVKPGRYKATWNTCPSSGKPFYAGTMIGELAIDIDQQTQLFTYVADTVAPTKRAAALGRDYKVVRFSGQDVNGIARTGKLTPVDAFARVERQLDHSGDKRTQPVAKQETFNAREFIDPSIKRKPLVAKKATPTKARNVAEKPTTTKSTRPTTKPAAKQKTAARPSLVRRHDLASANVTYKVR